ncbi:hypothetical protein [Kitasatospora sp. LaBMicrA B282]|uniref:hypothetical protein n=1 Tax=Kitasatospora sp. LaBMicrA B282 TaxID=3420949 RepID=UPI003D11C7C8
MFGGIRRGAVRFVLTAALAVGVTAPACGFAVQAGGGLVHRVISVTLDPDDNSWS